MGRMPIELARSLASELSLTRAEIDEYCGDLDRVGFYRLADMQLASVSVPLSELQRQLLYWPPQSFMFLSRSAKSVIDTACKFDEVPPARRRGSR